MTNQPIRAGVIGAGANTRSRHIPGLQAIDGVEVVAVCNRSEESGRRVANDFGIPHVYTHWWDVIAAPDIDAVVIGTWPYMHHRLSIAALEAGKHVMCEARMAMNAREAVEMRAAARAYPDLVAQIVPSPFTLRIDKTVRRLIAEGYLGDVLAIDVRQGGAFVEADPELHWRHVRDFSGLNMMSLGIWYEALLRWVGEASAVTAAGRTFVPMRRDPATGRMVAGDIPDHLNVLADMACGAQLSVQISSVTGLAPARMDVCLYGSEGTLCFADGVLRGGRRGDEELRPLEISDDEAGGWRVEEEFISAIRGREAITHTSFEDGVKYMVFTEAVARSLDTRRTVPLREVASAAGA
ncbi:MAG: Gfo/Idh/MocA family oxidoreductase [Caldilineaceae bacterium]